MAVSGEANARLSLERMIGQSSSPDELRAKLKNSPTSFTESQINGLVDTYSDCLNQGANPNSCLEGQLNSILNGTYESRAAQSTSSRTTDLKNTGSSIGVPVYQIPAADKLKAKEKPDGAIELLRTHLRESRKGIKLKELKNNVQKVTELRAKLQGYHQALLPEVGEKFRERYIAEYQALMDFGVTRPYLVTTLAYGSEILS